jgi:hypothetical protein
MSVITDVIEMPPGIMELNSVLNYWLIVDVKVINFVPFRPEWSKHSIPIQKIKQNGINFISF